MTSVYKIEDFIHLNKPEYMVITQHSLKRFTERGIVIDDVCDAISNGEIIEHYGDDFPFPSCLILGESKNKPLHVVASINGEYIYVITSYIPDSERWENDWKTWKEEPK